MNHFPGRSPAFRGLAYATLLRAAVLGLGAAVLLFVAHSSAVEWLDWQAYDALMASIPRRSTAPAQTCVVLEIDDASLKRFPDPLPLWHEHLATVIEGLTAAKVQGLALDLIPAVSLERYAPEADEHLARALRAARNAGVPVYMGFGAGINGALPHPKFLYLASGLGYVNLFPDADGNLRRQRLTIKNAQGRPAPALGWLMATLGAAPPLDSGDKPLYIDYRLPPPERLSLAQAHDWAAQGDFAALRQALKDRRVFLGIGTLALQNDIHHVPVPFGPSVHGQITGVYLQANIAATLLSGPVLHGLPSWTTDGLVLAVGLLSGWAFLRWRVSRALALTAAVSAGIPLLAGGLFYGGWVLPVAAFAPAWALSACASGLYRVVTREMRLRQLIDAEKLAALGQLVMGVAHEMNTPIGNCLITASYLKQQSDTLSTALDGNGLKKSQLQHYLRDALDGLLHLDSNLARSAQLIRDFKAIAATAEAESRQRFELREVLQDAVLDAAAGSAGPLRQTLVECPVGIVLHSFPGALRQAVGHLVSNALRHAYAADVPGTIQVRASKNRRFVQIVVSDQGRGVPKENLNRLFEPFFTTTRGEGCIGLGLTIAHNLVTQVLQGRISLSARPGQGLEVTMDLPL
jgi:signal transduction histidine kinase